MPSKTKALLSFAMLREDRQFRTDVNEEKYLNLPKADCEIQLIVISTRGAIS